MIFQVVKECESGYIHVMDVSTAALFLGLFGSMMTLFVGSIWYQHRDIRETRSECARLIKESNTECTRRVERATDKLSAEFGEHRRFVEKQHSELKCTIDDNRRLNEKQHSELKCTIDDNRRLNEKQHSELRQTFDRFTIMLTDVVERLARLEEFMRHDRRDPQPLEHSEGVSNPL